MLDLCAGFVCWIRDVCSTAAMSSSVSHSSTHVTAPESHAHEHALAERGLACLVVWRAMPAAHR